MKIVGVTNQKGGVGKTTSSFHIVQMASEICAEEGPTAQVGVIDFCGQGNLSSFLTGDYQINKESGGAELLFESEQPAFRDTLLENVKLLHGHRDLELLDADDDILNKAVQMREWLRKLPFKYLIIDTPPALGPRIAAPLIWADLAIVVIEPHVSSLTALDDTFETIDAVRAVNVELEVKIVVNQVVKAAKMHKDVLAALDAKFGSMIDDKLTLRTAIAEACQNHIPVWRHSKDKALKQQWRDFAIRALA